MLRETIETGKAVSLKDLPEEVDPHDLRDFITAMNNIASVKADELCCKIDLKGASRLLDLAGGPGTYAIAFAKANPQLNAVVFDLGHTIKLTQEFIKAAGMEDRVTTQAGNCLEDTFGKISTIPSLSQTSCIFIIPQTTRRFSKMLGCLKGWRPGYYT